jgi:hypothetical protein
MSDDYRRDLETIAKLDGHQFAVTRLGVIEPAFDNELWDKHDAGIYVDIVPGSHSAPISRREYRESSSTGRLTSSCLLALSLSFSPQTLSRPVRSRRRSRV